MKITVLFHLEKEGDTAHDVVVDQVAAALKRLGHRVSLLGVHGDPSRLSAGLRRQRPDLVFNLLETFGDGEFGLVAAVGFLDLLKVPYTGDGPGEYYIQEDKALTKKLLAFDQVRFPDFAVFSRDADLETGGNLRLPLFVKPLRMDASIGIDRGSVVRCTDELMERVLLIHRKVKDSALVEEFIEGREFYVGVLGNAVPQAFPPVEMDFSGLPEGTPRILDSRAKWDEKSPEYRGTRAVINELPVELRAKLQEVALSAYRALRVRDYGRVDLRLTEAGEVYVIEVNASCYLEQSSEFAAAAAAAGIDYNALVGRIVEVACERHGISERRRTRRTSNKSPRNGAVKRASG
jgi:D-alanine-D-alanine ligase